MKSPSGGEIMTDREALIKYSESRDADAFRHLVHTYRGLVYAASVRILGQSAEAEDVTQETFLKLANHSGDIHSNLGAWLYRCAVSKAMDRQRSATSRERREQEWAEMHNHANESKAPAELSQHVDTAIAELSEDDQELLVQYFFVGRKQAELAQVRDISQQAISKRLDSIVTTVREFLRKKGVAVSTTVLSTFLTESAANAAVPASLTAGLMKIGIAGVGQTATAAGGASAVAGSLSALLSVKGATLALLGVPILILATLIVMEHTDNDQKAATRPVQALQSATAAKPAPAAPLIREDVLLSNSDAAQVNPKSEDESKIDFISDAMLAAEKQFRDSLFTEYVLEFPAFEKDNPDKKQRYHVKYGYNETLQGIRFRVDKIQYESSDSGASWKIIDNTIAFFDGENNRTLALDTHRHTTENLLIIAKGRRKPYVLQPARGYLKKLWIYGTVRFADLIKNRKYNFQIKDSMETVRDLQCHYLEGIARGIKVKLWISPEVNFSLVKMKKIRISDGKLIENFNCTDFQQIAPNAVLPTFLYWGEKPDQAGTYWKIKFASLDKPTEGYFDIEIPPNTHVRDEILRVSYNNSAVKSAFQIDKFPITQDDLEKIRRLKN